MFAMVMDRLTDEVWQESLSTMFADDIVICSESREQMKKKNPGEMEESRGLKITCSKTQYMCVNERKAS